MSELKTKWPDLTKERCIEWLQFGLDHPETKIRMSSGIAYRYFSAIINHLRPKMDRDTRCQCGHLTLAHSHHEGGCQINGCDCREYRERVAGPIPGEQT